ncbi:MAG: cyclopropane-fatty-acyl-phospholipid synthase family protein [Sneathiella sp.]|uniref:cyclopropane-fatty-acyl-phospholipid synthase family protein n=1 Tax=Sneathiella sp. TaxID=1964365 RepID=UPI00300371C3
MSDSLGPSPILAPRQQPVSDLPTTLSDPWLKALFHILRKIEIGHLTVGLPSGKVVEFGQQKDNSLSAYFNLHDTAVIKRIIKHNDIGLGETYMDGGWSTPDLRSLLELASVNEKYLDNNFVSRVIRHAKHLLAHLRTRNTIKGSRRNIAHHYDLGNDFYDQWLDISMTYSAALFEHKDQSLQEAQQNKYRNIANVSGLKSGDKVLEIGCGWGGFAEYATSNFDCKLDGLTLSKEQLDYTVNRLQNQNLAGRVDVQLQDYRDHSGQYDAIVSIEMFEAVGRENWDSYFQALKRNLKNGGKVAIQTITIAEDRFQNYLSTSDFIQKYIFPGGVLPSKSAFIASASRNGFQAKISHQFGQDYAKTLYLWDQEFQRNWPQIMALGYDDRFKKMWEFYLKYCEAGFRQETIDVVMFELS